MTPLSVSQIAVKATNWPPQGYWDTGAKVVSASIGNRFIVHQPIHKEFVIIEFDGTRIRGTEKFTSRFAARNRIYQLHKEEEE